MGLLDTILGGAKATIGANPLGLAIGVGQMALGAIQKKKAQAMTPSPVSPLDQSMYNILKRQRDAAATGTKYNPQIVAGQQLAKAMQRNAMNAGATPNMGLYNQMMAQTMQNIQDMTSRDIAQTNAQLGEQTARMADITRDLTLGEQSQKYADSALNLSDGKRNLFASIMPGSQNVKGGESADLSGITSSLYSENETLKKKLKEIEEQKKKEAEAAGNTLK